MVLARCYLSSTPFPCDVTLVGGKLVACSLTGSVLIEVRVEDIKDVDYKDSEVILTLANGSKLMIGASGPALSVIRDVGRFLELRVRFPAVSDIARTLLPLVSKLVGSLLNVLTTLGSNYPAGWIQLGQLHNELTLISVGLSRHGVDLSRLIEELGSAINSRNVGIIRNLFKRLIFEATDSSKKAIRSLLTFEDVSSLTDLIVLAHTVSLARSLNQPLEAERILTELNKVCYIDIYVRVLERPSVNLCEILLKSLKEGENPHETVNKFLETFISILYDKVYRVSSQT